MDLRMAMLFEKEYWNTQWIFLELYYMALRDSWFWLVSGSIQCSNIFCLMPAVQFAGFLENRCIYFAIITGWLYVSVYRRLLCHNDSTFIIILFFNCTIIFIICDIFYCITLIYMYVCTMSDFFLHWKLLSPRPNTKCHLIEMLFVSMTFMQFWVWLDCPNIFSSHSTCYRWF